MELGWLKLMLLGLQMAFGQQATEIHPAISKTTIEKIYACPRCRRALPPGPRKNSTPPKWKHPDCQKR